MKAHDLSVTLSKLTDKKVPVFLWGAPGIGKSSIVKQIAQKKDIGFIDLRLALMDPTDLKGIPFYDRDAHQALWAPPAFLPKDGEGILFLDELNSAPPSVQASAYQLILDRRVGEYELPDGWAIVAAGNREGDKGVTYKMGAPLANRFVHFEMDISVEDWCDWAYQNNIDESIIGYISYKNEHLFTFDAKNLEKSFATPRSWEYVDKVLKSEIDASVLLETISGAISKEVAVGYLSFKKVQNKLPNIEDILNSGEAEYPQEADVLHALSVGLVSAVLRDVDALDNVLKYSLNLKGEFSVKVVQDLQRNSVSMEHSAVFKEWVEKFAYLLA
ncbi:AAA domain-containing protein [Sulfurimonas lithotrophica]|uniref:AAA domain-containing protein n=1 Tax=Sulfurimonas lithotrophica TaxID=2590022 RepID=A0A5P8P2Z8_9BACT|nr:MoxR family ATPase [Sulfurimonas lithotrophica]QFR50036.1 AAA domain-containing protein [Sulfurimonas lithotrophica]